MNPPALVAHADWSVHPDKRWMAQALRRPGGPYLALPPAPVGPLDGFFAGLAAGAGPGSILVGFDFPIGLPAAYARRAGIEDFLPALLSFGADRWCDFYEIATTPEEISLARPFYPRRPGGRRRQDLWRALDLESWDCLHRLCDRRTTSHDLGDRTTTSRPAACPLFWTLGGNQVGRAAIVGWRDLLTPARRNGVDLAIWPFHGRLGELLRDHRFVVAETYPGEVYGHLDLRSPLRAHGGKRRQGARAACAGRLLAWAERAHVTVAPELRTEIAAGFGPDPGADDRFDAVIGLFGLINVLRDARPSGEPDDPVVRQIEGWILGQDAGPAGPPAGIHSGAERRLD